MTEIEIIGNSLIVHVKGIYKLLALKSRLKLPLEHVVGIERDPQAARKWWFVGFRFGVVVPGMLRTGHFYNDEGWSFWDVRNPEKAIVIHLKNERYRKLVVEVADPLSTVAAVREAIGGR